MAWQLIFKAPDESEELSMVAREPQTTPPSRRPVSMSLSLQLDPGTMVVVPAAGDDDDDVD